eukprot:Platyproteum_vivax@DN9168_c0_g1_i1.p1
MKGKIDSNYWKSDVIRFYDPTLLWQSSFLYLDLHNVLISHYACSPNTLTSMKEEEALFRIDTGHIKGCRLNPPSHKVPWKDTRSAISITFSPNDAIINRIANFKLHADRRRTMLKLYGDIPESESSSSMLNVFFSFVSTEAGYAESWADNINALRYLAYLKSQEAPPTPLPTVNQTSK